MILHQQYNSRGNFNFNANIYTDRGWVPHFHKNFELIYIMEGSLHLTVNGNTETMYTDDYALILENQVHSFEPNGHSKIWIAIFSEQFVPHFAGYVEKLEGERSVFRCSESVHDFINANLIDAQSSITMKKACFYAVCDEYIKNIPLTERKNSNNDLICRVLDYVESHYMEDISLSSAAERFGYEYHYLSRILNRGYHINFSSLVNEYRVDKAIELLADTEKSITDVAMESGFRSIRSFNHVFRRVTGVTPRDYVRAKTKPI
ncbi:MAG: helix-turn-helix domain-containing protein [Clostridia bacterium]|nr:helix-turn-helix domain-containing protein [Clostridia bacterium]